MNFNMRKEKIKSFCTEIGKSGLPMNMIKTHIANKPMLILKN